MSPSTYLPTRSGADHSRTGFKHSKTSPIENHALHIWHLHVGTVQLFIVGPGQDAWCAVSQSYYTGQIGTDEERSIARLAVQILARRHRDDKDIGPTEILKILGESEHQLRTGLPITAPSPEPEPDQEF